MAALVAATHFPEAHQKEYRSERAFVPRDNYNGFWKMGRRDKPGDDEVGAER
jgi:hypothetical protein